MVVFRIQKIKTWGQLAAAHAHNHRTRPTASADPTVANVIIKNLDDDLGAIGAARSVIGAQTIRKNAVLAVESIISASPEYFRPDDPSAAGTYDPARLDAWRAKVEPWIAARFPHAISVVLHLDESTPHYQVLDIPLDDTGKLNARGKYGGADKLRQWQTDAAKSVAGLGIDRGLSGSVAKHDRVKSFYGAINSVSAPKAPPEPQSLPPATFAERLPFGATAAARVVAESRYRMAVDARVKDLVKQRNVAVKKASVVELAIRKQRGAEATAAKYQRENDVLKAEADKIRALPLDDVLLKLYGAKEAKDSKPSYKSRKFDLPDGRQIAVTDQKWIDQGGKGGRGAINLVMYLESVEYKPALRILSDQYPAAAIASTRARDLLTTAAAEVKAAVAEPAHAPEPDERRWPKVKLWLMAQRGIPERLLDMMHGAGKVYADARGNAVFPRADGGAFVRGTAGIDYKRTYGKAEAGPYVLPGDEPDIMMCEGPIDALALKAMHPHSTVIAVGGNLLKLEHLIKYNRNAHQWHIATDNDPAGDRLAEQVQRHFKGKRYAPPRDYKDWAEYIRKCPSAVHFAYTDEQGRGTAPVAAPAPAAAPAVAPAQAQAHRPKLL